jgi:hypothetical protein
VLIISRLQDFCESSSGAIHSSGSIRSSPIQTTRYGKITAFRPPLFAADRCQPDEPVGLVLVFGLF